MRERFGEITARGADVLVVSFSPVETLAAHGERLGLPFSIAADPDRRAYRAYGLLIGTRWQLWHPRVWWRYTVLLMRGMKAQRRTKGADLSQLGGDFVIAPDGTLSFAYLSMRPDDRPAAGSLIAALPRA